MFKDTITYIDYNGNQQTVDLYFNISKAEMIKLQFSEKNGFDKKLKAIAESDDAQQIMNQFMEIVDLAYGIKSEDGTRFIKSPEILAEFKETEAYSEFLMKLMTEDGFAAKFSNGIVPNLDVNVSKNFLPANQ